MRSTESSHIVEARSAFKQHRIVRDDRAALSGGNRLARLMAKYPDVPHRARRLTLIAGAHGLRGVFEHLEIVLPRDGKNLVHVGWRALQVDGDQDLRVRGNAMLDIGRVDVEGFVDL